MNQQNLHSLTHARARNTSMSDNLLKLWIHFMAVFNTQTSDTSKKK